MNFSNKEKLSKSLGDSIMKIKMEEALKKYKFIYIFAHKPCCIGIKGFA